MPSRQNLQLFRDRRIADLAIALLNELGFDLSVHPDVVKRASRRHTSNNRLKPHLSIPRLCKQYLAFAHSYYRTRDGKPAKEAVAIAYALRPLRKMFRRLPVTEFGPRKLKEVRDSMIALGWSRGHINKQIGRIKRMFKWAASNEMLPASIHHALLAVDGLKLGRTTAYEPKPIRPVSEELVQATLPHVSFPVAAMIQLQLLTGMRPGEVTIMRLCDIDRTIDPWSYTPQHHKTEQHGHERVIILGPKAQQILSRFVDPTRPTDYLFSPIDAELERRQKVHDARKTPMSCGNRPGTNRRIRPKREPGQRYDTQAYGHAIRYGCRKAFPAPTGLDPGATKRWHREHMWHPHQLRHNAATKLRKEFGLDIAQVVLGHASLAVTQVYAERDISAAQAVMRKVG